MDVDPSVKYYPKSKFPAKAMSFGLVTSDDFTIRPLWIDGNLDSTKYINLLEKKVIPSLDSKYGRGKYVFQQDGAPCHTSVATQKYLESILGSKGFWLKHFWPPNSPNLNPLDYHVWTHVETRACATNHPNVAALKRSMEKK